jgi:hypothetical protein
MIDALIEFNKDGRVKQIFLVGMTDAQVGVAEYRIMRLVLSAKWGWLR